MVAAIITAVAAVVTALMAWRARKAFTEIHVTLNGPLTKAVEHLAAVEEELRRPYDQDNPDTPPPPSPSEQAGA